MWSEIKAPELFVDYQLHLNLFIRAERIRAEYGFLDELFLALNIHGIIYS